MLYEIMLRNKNGSPEWRQYVLFDGMIPDSVFDLMTCEVVEHELDLCRLCDVQGARCHVFEIVFDKYGEPIGRKMCPILFADVVKPEWSVGNVA